MLSLNAIERSAIVCLCGVSANKELRNFVQSTPHGMAWRGNDVCGGTRAPATPDIKTQLEWLCCFGYADKNCVPVEPVLAVDLAVEAVGAILKNKRHWKFGLFHHFLFLGFDGLVLEVFPAADPSVFSSEAVSVQSLGRETMMVPSTPDSFFKPCFR